MRWFEKNLGAAENVVPRINGLRGRVVVRQLELSKVSKFTDLLQAVFCPSVFSVSAFGSWVCATRLFQRPQQLFSLVVS